MQFKNIKSDKNKEKSLDKTTKIKDFYLSSSADTIKFEEFADDYIDNGKVFFESKGYIIFNYINIKSDSLKIITKSLYYEKENIEIFGDLMSGKDFYDCVDSGCIINYDGVIGYVFVNGLKSNLGLKHRGLSQGDFLVDGETWLTLCEDFDIMVEWCNK